MAQQYFVLGIGGTGMRCIESLIHLCGMGMFDDTDIYLLALDTDKDNGNFARLKEVKESYVKAKGTDASQRTALNDTFFSANIHYYEFSPNYEIKSDFKSVFNYGDTKFNNPEQTAIADLVLTENVENFNLRHGYRAQTHLGSMMMYHSILEAARSNQNNQLKSYLHKLIQVSQNGGAKVFILGSVFGGTGASSIPIIPQAISKAAEIISNGAANILNNAYFGSTLLTAYFNFKTPTGAELENQKIIATSDKFALNSQVAMMFYDDDATVKSTYQKFFMLGTPGIEWNPMAKKEQTETITGGASQRNDSHYVELLAACAALHFLRIPEEELRTRKQNNDTEYLYRAVDDNGKLEFRDFVGQELEQDFAKKLGLFTAFSLFCNGEDDFVNGVKSGHHKDIVNFLDIDNTQIKDGVKEYFRLFHFAINPDDTLYEGWLRQLHRSAGSDDKFLLNAALFTPQKRKDLMKYKWNKDLFKTVGVGKDNKFDVSLFGSKFDEFKKEFIKQNQKTMPGMTNRGEQLYKRIYDTLVSLYKF